MWPFKKRKNQVVQSEVPQEIKEYYQAERRERKGIAGLLAIATLVVTILVALVLFFGGRWAYRKIAGTNKPKATPTTSQQAAETAKSNEQKAANDQSNGTKGAQTTPAPAPSTSPSHGTSSAVTTTPGTATPTPPTGTALPRTGPDQDL